MATISHQELLDSTREILDRVKGGEIVDVTENGRVAATLVPPSTTPFEHLLLSGAVRPSRDEPVDFRCLPRIKGEADTVEILTDLRDDR
ncbi:type II toxin-antitoxin system Phd/YefM family antitoxin [Arthrobacter cupressi]